MLPLLFQQLDILLGNSMHTIRFPFEFESLCDFNQRVIASIQVNPKINNLSQSSDSEQKDITEVTWDYSLNKVKNLRIVKELSNLINLPSGIIFLVSSLVFYLLSVYSPYLVHVSPTSVTSAYIGLAAGGCCSLVIWIMSVSICEYLLKKKRQPEELKKIISDEKIFLKKAIDKAQKKYDALKLATQTLKITSASSTLFKKSMEKLEDAQIDKDLYQVTLDILSEWCA